MNSQCQNLSETDRTRYLRQMAIEGFGESGQCSLKRSTVTIMGVGGLGSPAAMYLAAAGVGKIILVDFQSPDLSNLNRQVLHWEGDVKDGTKKAVSAANKLREMNSEIEIIPKAAKIGIDGIRGIVEDSVVILDCLDNFDARKLLNAHCISEDVPFVHAAVEGFSGQLTVIIPGQTPCLECLFPTPPAKKPIIPIIGYTAGVFGCLEAAEAVKLITGVGVPLTNRLLACDLSVNYWETIEVERNKRCPVCCGH
ncbi:MAG TPA: HesA/MoeB/ThiF family protein [Methanomassiliicoccales archaeon]|jgi:adenylyltransferase/sulfurtransferase